MQLNINTDAVVNFTNTLEKLHRSALPSAIRGSLNKAAFDVKTKTMPESADANFVKRQPNFFKANSRFEYAKGFNVNAMKATIGFVEKGLKGSNNYAVRDLEEQEQGGTIEKKSFIPLAGARNSNSNTKNIRSNARLSSIKNIIDARKAQGVNARQRFIKSVIHAGVGGHVLSNFKGKNILWKVNSLKRSDAGSMKLTALYSFKKGRTVSVGGTGFMKKASVKSANKIEGFYVEEAMRQIKKFSNFK